MTPISSPRPHRPASGQALRKARPARLVRVAAGAAGLCLLLALGFGHLALAAAGRAATQPAGPRTVPVRLTEWFDDLRLSLVAVEDRPDNPAGSTTYVIKDVFTTRNGEWTVSGDPYTVPDWAITTYLTPDFQKAYERNNLYGAVLDRNGNFIPGQGILYWTGGIEKLTDLGSTVTAVIQANETPGWATMVLFGSSSYDPASGQSGPWCWTPSGLRAEVLCGGGLPNGLAVSTFVVWQEVDDPGTATPTVTPSPTFTTTPEVTPSPTVTTTPEVTVTPTMTTTPEVTATPTLTPTPVPTIVRRVGTWVDDMNLRVRTLAERPDEIAQSDVTYLIKDIFTTRDGQWEPSSIFGSVDQWARDAYLKPADDPEYFDDAGADRHLFAAIFGLDGKLQKNADLLYWSDGFEMLGDPNYDGYVMGVDGARYPRTKDRSGWGNMFMSTGSSYVPERGEMGPWCWVPRGLAAEVMCGGGMPANNHISTFVVWQAVQGTILQPMPEGDFFVYMPAISDE